MSKNYLYSATKADIDHVDQKGLTFLHHACKNRDLQEIQFSLANNANPNIKNNNGWNPIQYMYAELLFDNITDINTVTTEVDIPSTSNIVQLLLDYGIDVNAQDNYGNTALHLACMVKDLKAANFLIQKGINLSIKNEQGQSAGDILISTSSEMEIQNLADQFKDNFYTEAMPFLTSIKRVNEIWYANKKDMYIPKYIAIKILNTLKISYLSDFSKTLAESELDNFENTGRFSGFTIPYTSDVHKELDVIDVIGDNENL